MAMAMRRRLGPLLFAGSIALASCRNVPSAGTDGAADAAPAAAAATSNHVARTDRAAVEEPQGDAARGHELVVSYECRRCHDGTGVEAEPVTRHCVGCHARVMAGGFDGRPKAPEWRRHVAHLSVAPSLTSAGSRFQRRWFVEFLVEPHDLRPALTQQMPRLALTREQARDVVAYFESLSPKAEEKDGTPLSTGESTRGRAVMDAMQCGSCHRMTGVPPLAAAAPLEAAASPTYSRSSDEKRPAVMLAPDLRHTRDRMTPKAILAWLLDPAAVKPDTLMPKPSLTRAQALDVVAYLTRGELAVVPAAPTVEAPPLLDRRVGYEEVARRVLDVTCRHCHGNPVDALGDGGPGNTGGFGFPRRGINFTSYEQTQGGYLDDEKKRHSLFEPMPDGTPRIVAALWARHREVEGKPDPRVRGMPLGLPPLPPEEIQLIATWAAQGRPR